MNICKHKEELKVNEGVGYLFCFEEALPGYEVCSHHANREDLIKIIDDLEYTVKRLLLENSFYYNGKIEQEEKTISLKPNFQTTFIF